MVPLVPSFVSLPFPLGSSVSLASIVVSIYGACLAVGQGTQKLAAVAIILTLLNTLSLIFLSSPSFLIGLFYTAYAFIPSLATLG